MTETNSLKLHESFHVHFETTRELNLQLSLYFGIILAYRYQYPSFMEIEEQMPNGRVTRSQKEPSSHAFPWQESHIQGHTWVYPQHEPAFCNIFLEVFLCSEKCAFFSKSLTKRPQVAILPKPCKKLPLRTWIKKKKKKTVCQIAAVVKKASGSPKKPVSLRSWNGNDGRRTAARNGLGIPQELPQTPLPPCLLRQRYEFFRKVEEHAESAT